jgi:putative ABC transport system permease protein
MAVVAARRAFGSIPSARARTRLFRIANASHATVPLAEIRNRISKKNGAGPVVAFHVQLERRHDVKSIALKMLMGDRAKFFGILMGLTFASLLITQQMAIFIGLMTRTYGFVTDAQLPDVWVMDPKVQFVDDMKPLQETQLFRTRSVEGVDWAVPMYRGFLRVRLEDGNFQMCIVNGLDDATLIGGPARMVEGTLEDLRRSEGVVVDRSAALDKLAKPPLVPGGPRIPLAIGDTIEVNDHRAVVVGFCETSPTRMANPVIYTTYNRALTFAPHERKLLTFVLVKAKAGQSLPELCSRIEAATGLKARPKDDLERLTVDYYMKYTGIPVNFGIAVLLGFIVGIAIAGQTFYNFTLENLRHFGALKAMGASNRTLLSMIVLQAVLVGAIGYGLGVGGAALFGEATKHTALAFRFPWELLFLSAGAIAVICVLSAFISIRKVFKLEPAIVFKG